MIERTIERWHQVIAGDWEALDDLLAEDVVFHSPVVFTPQKGRDVTKLYLAAAGNTLGGGQPIQGGSGGKFRYTKKVLADPHAVLEFETELDGKHVNGVDIITRDRDGRIAEFRVMVRPLQAIQAVHARMARMLEAMKGGAAAPR